MHVVFVSCCEKKAIKRTRALLDSYAKRTGGSTWLTPITQEGLSELHKALRKAATRQTSIACFRNDGMKRMRLLWVVGNNKHFDYNGISPIATTKKTNKYYMPDWAKICALIAETAGYLHDIGKFNKEFQDKLLIKKHIKDNVRHEWLSMFLTHLMIEGNSWEEAVDKVVNNPKQFSDRGNRKHTLIFTKQLESITDALLYCIATHHKLPCLDQDDVITNDHHVNRNKSFPNPVIPLKPSEKILTKIHKNINKLKKYKLGNDKIYWRAMATLSRMALILADQSISAIPDTPDKKINLDNKIAYANTHGKDRKLNQELSWHLEKVGIEANKMMFRMLNIPLPGLSQNTVEKINTFSVGRYCWQNKVASALLLSAKQENTPYLIFNIAGTGSGKTRMNLRVLASLNEDKPLRVAAALNLRTLTLQTGDAYQKQVGIEKNEIACVIGNSLVQKLHESKYENVDEDEPEYGLDVFSDFEFDLPTWLQFYSDKNPKLSDVIGAPLLVSTIDFLIAAGEPHRKHHHILASMRLMHSDLILDEIDGYEPAALLSVLRLVTMSAMFGKNVVASSATLSKPVARMIWKAYEHGAEMRGLINVAAAEFKTGIIDDLIKPTIGIYPNEEEFLNSYTSHINNLMKKLDNKLYRVPIIAEIPHKTKSGWLEAIKENVIKLHNDNAWSDKNSGKKLSFGLVTIANISTAITVAKYLSQEIPESKVVCYHSNHILMQRFIIEKRLDFLLTRKDKNPNQHILDDLEIRHIIQNSNTDVLFIVVATPVEEIGRDHDFDWAVIEPSSSQSIVQTSGRVNRHRLLTVKKANIALLQYCFKEIGSNSKDLVFKQPGLETTISNKDAGEFTSHPSHDLKALFNWNELTQVDSRMRFCSETHPFPKYDDNAIENETKKIMRSMMTEDNLWMARETYTESSLRESKDSIELCIIDPNNPWQYYVTSSVDGSKDLTKILNWIPRETNDWLILSDSELIEKARNYNIYDSRVITVSMPFYQDNHSKPSASIENKIIRHASFGFYIKNKSSNNYGN